MKTLMIITATGLAMLAAPIAAEETGATTSGTAAPTDYMSQSQGMLPAGDRARSYDNSYDNLTPATADPQVGPQGGDEGGAGEGAGEAGAGGGEAGEGAAGEGASGGSGS